MVRDRNEEPKAWGTRQQSATLRRPDGHVQKDGQEGVSTVGSKGGITPYTVTTPGKHGMTPMTNSHTTLTILRSSPLLALLLIMGSHAMAHAESSQKCRRWIAEVKKGGEAGPSEAKKGTTSLLVPEPDPWGVASLSETEKLQAIECLLTLESDFGPAAFGGAVRLDVSQTFAPPHVNLAALYAISYVYSGRFDHAAAVALRGEGASTTDSRGNYVTKSATVHKAYGYYRTWFAKVRQLGIAAAREKGLQPLEGSGLTWY